MKAPNTQIIIRPIARGDFNALFLLLSRAFTRAIEIRGFDPQRFQRNARLYSLSKFVIPLFDLFHKDYPALLVAVSEDRIVGEVHLVPIGKRTWTIDSLAVDPTYSGQGIGRNLIREAIEYAKKRRGKKVLSTIRTDNTPALKIAERLGFTPLQKTEVFFQKTENQTAATIPPNASIRRFRPIDAKDVFTICDLADPRRTEAYNMTPKDFINSVLDLVLDKMLQLHSERLVLEAERRIVGYAKITYTSRREAAKVEYFCILPSPHLPRLADALLTFILNYLEQKNIERVRISIGENRKETIESLKQKGFQRLTSLYEIAKNLD